MTSREVINTHVAVESPMWPRSRCWRGCGSSPDELETFTGQLNSIVDYVAQLQELDTTGVEPLAHGIEVRNVFRDDVRGQALPREQALANAPKRNRTSFLVPAVLE